MATLKITGRSDAYPVGTTVYAYPANAKITNGKPSGAAITNATVAADGSLTLSGVPEAVQLVLWALVGGLHVYLTSEAGLPVAPRESLQERIRNRRQAIGSPV